MRSKCERSRSIRGARALIGVVALVALGGGALVTSGCAETSLECTIHSDCGEKRYCDGRRCKRDCVMNFDCSNGLSCNEIGQCVSGGAGDGGSLGDGGGVIDAAVNVDAAVGVDGAPALGRYLDRCVAPGECASVLCVDDVGGSKLCSKSCAGDGDCADEHVCGSGSVCRPDDTGRPCSLAAPANCAKGLCLGAADLAASCTKPCANAADCPAGYACANVQGQLMCVDIEKPCTTGDQCASTLCLSATGCTSFCRTTADCPARLVGLPPYTCAIAFGSSAPICVPPSDILGPDAAGALCRDAGSGLTFCRSGACDDAAPLGPMCTQACSAESNCAPGLGCFPIASGGSFVLACSRAGSRALTSTCSSGRECASGLCDATRSQCTRLCQDGLCPTGWTCEPVAGAGIAICRR